MCSPFRRLGMFLLSTFVIGLLLSPAVFAQNRGFIGKVTNEKGEVVANAKVTIRGVTSKFNQTVTTDKKGQYVWMNLSQGSYWIVVRAPGYDPAATPASADPGLSPHDFVLKPGNPDLKLDFELTPEEHEKINRERANIEKQNKLIGEIKKIFDDGRALADQANYAGAIEQFKNALAKAPDEPTVLANLADAYYKNNQLDESVATYQKAIGVKEDAALWTNLGVVLGKMGKTAESKAAFQKAAILDPAAAAQNFYNLGATLVNSGQAKDGAEAFRTSIKADASYAESYFQLGLCLSGDPATVDEAVQNLQKYVQIGKNTDNVEVAKQLIVALKKK